MKKYLIIVILAIQSIGLFAQSKKINNLKSFTGEKIVRGALLEQKTTALFRNHPEYGKLPHNAPPYENCVEVLEKRTENSRYFVESQDESGENFILQQSYGPLHYKNEKGFWVSIDRRLKKISNKVFRVNNPDILLEINAEEKLCRITSENKTIVFNHSLELILEKADHSISSLGKANWSDFTAGDDGVYVRNCWPGIDMQMIVHLDAIKTEFIINKPLSIPYSSLKIRDRPQHDGILNARGVVYATAADVKINDAKGTELFKFGVISAFDQKEEDPVEFPYHINDDVMDLVISGEWLNSSDRIYPVTIDPLVSASNVTLKASILGSKFSPTCWVDYCDYNMDVPVPPKVTVTDTRFSFNFKASSPCTINKGAMRFQMRSCLSPNLGPTIWWTCVNNSTGSCIGNDISIFNDFQTCFNPPQCAGYTVPVQFQFSRCAGIDDRPSCSSSCVGAETNWLVTIYGRTLELSANKPAPLPVTTQTICSGDQARIGNEGAFGVPPYSYSWTNSTSTDSVIFVTPTQTTSYLLTIKDQCGEQVTRSFTVNVTQGQNPGFTINPNPNCVKSPVIVTGSGSASASSYDWLFPGSNTPQVNNTQTINNLEYPFEGTYTITLNFSVNGCPFPASKTIEIKSKPNLVVSGDTAICGPNPILLKANAGFDKYEWKLNGNVVSTSDSLLYNGGDLKLYAGFGSGCRDTFSINLTPVNVQNSDFSVNPNPVCVGNPVSIKGGGSYPDGSYDWLLLGSDKDKVDDKKELDVKYNTSGTFDITLNLNVQGCLFPVKKQIDVQNKNFVLKVDGTPFTCGIDSLLLISGSGFDKYEWFLNGNPFSQNDSVNFKGGSIKVLATDKFGCRDSFQYSGYPLIKPKANFDIQPTPPVDALSNVSFTDQSTPADSIQSRKWLFQPPGDTSDASDPNYIFLTGGLKNVTLVVKNKNGCTDTITKSFFINPLPMPNVFTPNGDTTNQYFVVPDLPNYPSNKIIIFNRWGNVVFEKENYKNDWDGGDLPSGTYYYVISAEGMETMKGAVTILKD